MQILSEGKEFCVSYMGKLNWNTRIHKISTKCLHIGQLPLKALTTCTLSIFFTQRHNKRFPRFIKSNLEVYVQNVQPKIHP